MSSGKDKENVKLKLENGEKLDKICTQNKFGCLKYTVLRIKTSSQELTYIANCFINNIKRIGIANTIKTAKDFAAIKIRNYLLQEDKKCEVNLINSLEDLHVKIHIFTISPFSGKSFKKYSKCGNRPSNQYNKF